MKGPDFPPCLGGARVVVPVDALWPLALHEVPEELEGRVEDEMVLVDPMVREASELEQLHRLL